MKKMIIAALAATSLTSPAFAADNVSITATGTVAPTCEASASVRNVAGDSSNVTPIGYDPTTQTTTTTTGASSVSLASTAPQLLASVTARCNTGTATVSLNTANNFKLFNGAGGANREVGYLLNLSGGGGASGISANGYTGTIGGTGPTAQQTRSLSFVLPTAVNPITLHPGAYADTITVTFTPNS